MNVRGMTLIELVASLAIASLVAAIAFAGSVPLAAQVRGNLASARQAGGPDEILRAMLADVRADSRWSVCAIGSGCPVHTGRGHGMALLANDHAWSVHDAGVQACSAHHCEGVLAGVVALQFVVDHDTGKGVRRAEAIRRRDTEGARRLEVRLWLADGSQRSRSLWIAR